MTFLLEFGFLARFRDLDFKIRFLSIGFMLLEDVLVFALNFVVPRPWFRLACEHT